MTAILTAAEMREAERRAMESGHVTGLALMERAGQGVVEAVLTQWPELTTGRPRATVLCGPGNNGGDGFAVARLLVLRGWQVRVLFSGDPLRLSPDAREMHDRWGALGQIDDLTEATLRAGGSSDLYVDAIFGLGLDRPAQGDIADVLSHMGGRNGDLGYYQPRTVAVDAPSGLDLDSGRVLGATGMHLGVTLHAALTVTFQTLKPGHLLMHGPTLCGRVVVADIGIGPWVRMDRVRFREGQWSGTHRPLRLSLVEPGEPLKFDPGAVLPDRLEKGRWADSRAHKYSHGHALLLSGGCGRGGAARLAARGALRIGAGLVTLAVPPAALQENAARLDAIMLRAIRDPDALAELLGDDRFNALCVGPGLGTSDREASLLAALLAAKRPTVLDADALTLLAQKESLRAVLHDKVVLTPHDGEFARLFPDLSERMSGPRRPEALRHSDASPEALVRWQAEMAAYHQALATVAVPAVSKVDAVREAARRLGCTVLLKGPDTVIADPPPKTHRLPEWPPSRAAINAAVYDRAAPWLATAGSGDVLAGFITGLLARGFAPFDAACTAAWLHVECARSFGPGLVAEDLPEELPKVFRSLGL